MAHIFITLNQLFLNQDFWRKFWRMKGANRYMKILLVLFQEQNSFGTIWSFQPLAHFLLFDWEWSNWARPLLIGSLNSQDMISFMITTGSLNSEDMISQVNIYVMDGYYEMFLCGGQNSWFCEASLRICYVSLLKTVINCHVWNRELQN